MTIARSLVLASLLLTTSMITIEAMHTYEFGRPVVKRTSNLRNRVQGNTRQLLDALNGSEVFRPIQTTMSVSYSYSYTYYSASTHEYHEPGNIGDVKSDLEIRSKAGNDTPTDDASTDATPSINLDLQSTVIDSVVSAVPRTGDSIEDQNTFGSSNRTAMIGVGMASVVSSVVVAIYVVLRNQRKSEVV